MPSPRREPADTRYLVRRFELISLADGSELIYCPENQASISVPLALSRLLGRCRDPKTLREHAHVLRSQGLAGTPLRAVEQVLAELAEAGILVSERELLSRLRRSDAPTDGVLITALGVPTCNRPEALRRLLDGFLTHAHDYGRALEVCVADDSREASMRALNEAVVGAALGPGARRVFYAGPEEKAAFVQTLVRERGLPQEEVEFALLGPRGCGATYGANRNILLLHTAGEGLFAPDDDMVCRGTPAPETGPELMLGGEGACWFFTDRTRARQLARAPGEDFFGMHERLLGRSIGGCVSALPEEQVRVNGPLQGSGEERAWNARVRVTHTGILGDFAMDNPLYYLMVKGDTRQRLLRSEAHYRAAYRCRQVLFSLKHTTIVPTPTANSCANAYDNRIPLPPFLPAFRGEDVIFGQVLRTCFAAWGGHLPWAMLHAPVKARRFTREQLDERGRGVMVFQLLGLCLPNLAFGDEVDGALRMRSLGQQMVGLASLPPADFEEHLRSRLWMQNASMLDTLDRLLDEFEGRPRFWAEDLRRHLHVRREALRACKPPLPQDLPAGLSEEEARTLTQRLVLRYGRLLCVWPDIVAEAAALRQDGRRLGRELKPRARRAARTSTRR